MADSNIDTEYDDVFRTLLNDFPHLAIPLINEIFGYNYSPHDKVHLGNNELFIRDTDGKSHKRITDSSIYINNDYATRFHIECQSTDDDTMLIRMYEYDTQIAINNSSTIVDDMLTVRFPNSGVLYLRSTKKTPKFQRIKIIAGDQQLIHKVHIMKMSDYTLDDIFKKNLLFLLPFYIFNFEHSFKHPKKNEDYMASITTAFLTIKEKLEELLYSKQINELTKLALQRLIGSVSSKIANKHDDVKKGVTSIMGGKILDYPEKQWYKADLQLQNTNKLYSQLFAAGRIKDAERASNEPAYREQLLKDFGLYVSDSNIILSQ